MANDEAKVAAYNSAARRYERRAAQSITSLREALHKAERRLNSDNEMDRQLLSSSGTEVASEAAAFAEAAAAWTALREVSFLTEDEK